MKELKDYTKIKKDREDCWRETAFQMSSIPLQVWFLIIHIIFFAVFFGFHFRNR